MTDHLCNNRHRILAVLQSLGAEPDSEEVTEVFQALEAIVGDLDSRLHAERLANAAIAQDRDESWERAITQAWVSADFDSLQLAERFVANVRQRLDAESIIMHHHALASERDEARQALADRDAQWERAMLAEWGIDGEDYVAAIRLRLDAESNPPHLATSDEESNRPKNWSSVRQRLRDAGADRWDHQQSEREGVAAELQEYQLPGYLAAIDLLRSENHNHAADRLRAYLRKSGWKVTTSRYGSTAHRDFNGGGGISNSEAGTSNSVIRDRDAGDEDPSGWPIEESLADFDKRCQHEEDGRDGYVERMLD